MTYAYGRQDAAPSPTSTRPIIGGDTAVTLTSAAALQSLHISVSALGSGALDTSGDTPVADFPVTGGTEGPGAGNEVVLHQGSGLELNDSTGTLDLRDFRVDTQNDAIYANVNANGTNAGNVAAFDIGSGGTLTLTEKAADVANQVLGTTALTPNVEIGNAVVSPVISPFTIGVADDRLLRFLASHDQGSPPAPDETRPIIGGDTAVTLTSAATLQSLGVSVAQIGSASLDTSGDTPVAKFPVTGGTEGPGADVSVILHQGSGLELNDSTGTLDLRDFLIDTQNSVVDANVTVNGNDAGHVAVFDIGAGDSLTLTPAAADLANQVLGLTTLTPNIPIGIAAPAPIALPAGLASCLCDDHSSWSAPNLCWAGHS